MVYFLGGIHLNKFGQILQQEQLRMIYYASFVLFVALVIILTFSSSVHRDVQTQELREHISVNRLLSSQDCLSYVVDGDVRSGVIDLGKLSEVGLEECFSGDSIRDVGVYLSLYGNDHVLIKDADVNLELSSQRVKCDLKSSGIDCYKTRKYTQYYSEGVISQGYLDMVVVVDV